MYSDHDRLMHNGHGVEESKGAHQIWGVMVVRKAGGSGMDGWWRAVYSHSRGAGSCWLIFLILARFGNCPL